MKALKSINLSLILALSLTLSLLFILNSYAASEENGVLTSETTITQKVQTDGTDDADQIITNRKMRAESGSKSKFSISSSLEYAAGSINQPFKSTRPNIRGATGTTDYSKLSGAIGLKYSLNSLEALKFGVGMRWITPFEAQKPKGYNGNKIDVDNPYLTYQSLLNWFGGVQTVLTAGPTLFTATNLKNAGYLSSWDLALNNAYNIGKSRFSIGMVTQASYMNFNKTQTPSGASLLDIQSDYGMGAYPFLEYEINDRLNLRTISGLLVYEHLRSEASAFTFEKNKVYQSFGLGVSVTRDIFLYPNVQFIPAEIRANNTNVALSANINLL